MDKKKVFIAIHQLNIGGVQKALIEALNAIDYTENDVTLYIRKNRLELLEQVNPAVSSVIINRDPTKYYRKPYAVWLFVLSKLLLLMGRDNRNVEEKLRQFVVKKQLAYERKHFFPKGARYDVAISYIQGYTAEFVAKYVPADKKIMFFHGSADENHALHERILPQFDRIVAVNAGCRDVLRELYPAVKEKIDYIENYVDAASIREAAKAYEIDHKEKPIVLCTCGRFTPVKGFDLAVETAMQLKERGFDFIWYFVGDGEQRAVIETQINSSGLTDEIHITGILENPYPYYAGCDIYIQPSYEEAQPLAIIEAQILCRPVVTTATVGGKSLVQDGETGLIADISPDGIAEKIALLLTNDALRAHIESVSAQTDRTAEAKAYRDAWTRLLSAQEAE